MLQLNLQKVLIYNKELLKKPVILYQVQIMISFGFLCTEEIHTIRYLHTGQNITIFIAW